MKLIPWKTLWKSKTDTFFMSQNVVLNIKLATVNSIPFLELAQLFFFTMDICCRWCKLNFEPSLGSGELQDKTCKQQVYFSCCLTLLTTAVSHEVKSSNYRCRNFNHQTYYSSPYWNHIWQSRFALLLCYVK